ncbi:MAG: helix-turn-helix transcriptional regulator [Acidobacteria bacterium]|nr:helix-turn-helix transcriptional regulator [Acidobacteriota bacterium]
MQRYLTRTLNMARFLTRKYFMAGREAFREELSTCVGFLAGQFPERSPELRSHLEAILDALLHGFCDADPDRVARLKARFPWEWRGETEAAACGAAFLRDVEALVDGVESDMAAEDLGGKAARYLKECPEEVLRNLTLESLADTFHYSRTHFAERFHRERGITVHDALTHEKMHRAFRLLSEGEPPPTVRELTHRLGFSDPVYFSRVFRKIYGMLPSRVRGE